MSALPPQWATLPLLVAGNVFITCAWLCMYLAPRLDHLWAALCLMGAVYFLFRPSPLA